jgi:hypothetical protein
MIVFATGTSRSLSDNSTVLFQVSAAGGDRKALTTLDANKKERAHAWPELLPGGRAVVSTVRTGDTVAESHIAVLRSTQANTTRYWNKGTTPATFRLVIWYTC